MAFTFELNLRFSFRHSNRGLKRKRENTTRAVVGLKVTSKGRKQSIWFYKIQSFPTRVNRVGMLSY